MKTSTDCMKIFAIMLSHIWAILSQNLSANGWCLHALFNQKLLSQFCS